MKELNINLIITPEEKWNPDVKSELEKLGLSVGYVDWSPKLDCFCNQKTYEEIFKGKVEYTTEKVTNKYSWVERERAKWKEIQKPQIPEQLKGKIKNISLVERIGWIDLMQ